MLNIGIVTYIFIIIKLFIHDCIYIHKIISELSTLSFAVRTKANLVRIYIVLSHRFFFGLHLVNYYVPPHINAIVFVASFQKYYSTYFYKSLDPLHSLSNFVPY